MEIDGKAVDQAIIPLGEQAYERGIRHVREADARAMAYAAIKAYLSALEARGLVIVPREPTEGMKYEGARDTARAGYTPSTRDKEAAASIYRAMLASARKGGV